MTPRFLAVIPAYNEAATIARLAQLTQPHADVCVVDDASTDRTASIVAGLKDVHCIRHQRNTHIPQSLLDGMRYGFDAGYDFCITLDAGMSHDPQVLPQFKERTDADLVIGYRQQKVNVPGYRKALSFGGNVLMNLALNQGLPRRGKPMLRDVTSGYRMYSRAAVELLLGSKMYSRSFDFHLEALARVYRHGMKIAEVPIVYVHSNSSLRWRVVGHALQTWYRIGLTSLRRS